MYVHAVYFGLIFSIFLIFGISVWVFFFFSKSSSNLHLKYAAQINVLLHFIIGPHSKGRLWGFAAANVVKWHAAVRHGTPKDHPGPSRLMPNDTCPD